MLRFRFDVSGKEAFDRVLGGMVARIEDWRPLWQMIIKDWETTSETMFAHSGQVDGLEGWAVLTERYARWKSRRYPGMPILVRTGDLMRSVVSPVAEITPTSLTLRIESPIAAYHQFGTVRMTQRPPVRIAENEAQVQRWVRGASEHVFRESF